MRRRHVHALVLLAALTTTTGCSAVFRFIGDKTADLITQPTSTLADTAVTATFTRDIYPTDTRTVEAEGVPGWGEGKGYVLLTLLKRHGVGMHQLDGAVVMRKANGAEEPLPYLGKGAYGMVLPAGDVAARRIELRPSGGGVAAINVQPAAPVRIKAINGKREGAVVDLSKPLVVDLAEPGNAGGTKLKVALCTTVFGIRTFTDIAICKPASHLVVPAAAFRNLALTASMGDLIGIEKGANYVLVERYRPMPQRPAGVGATQVFGRSWASAPVTVEGEAGNTSALVTEGEVTNPRGRLHYRFSTPPAFYARPIHRIGKIALGSLGVRGSLFQQNSSTSTHEGGGYITTITNTTTLAFPPVQNSSWDGFLEGLRGQLGGALGGPLLASESVLNAPTYAQLEVAPDEASSVFVNRSYRGAPRSAFSSDPAKLVAETSSTFAADRPFCRLLAETGADTLAAVTYNVQIARRKDSEQIALVPALSVVLIGPPNGYTVGPTIYATGTISAEDGVPVPTSGLDRPGALASVVRQQDLMAGLRTALAALRQNEVKAGYEAIWALQ